jgi:inactivated superfamily I helicase
MKLTNVAAINQPRLLGRGWLIQAGLTDPVSASFDANMSAALPGAFVVHGYQTGRLAGTYSGGGSTTLSFVSADSFRVG